MAKKKNEETKEEGAALGVNLIFLGWCE